MIKVINNHKMRNMLNNIQMHLCNYFILYLFISLSTTLNKLTLKMLK